MKIFDVLDNAQYNIDKAVKAMDQSNVDARLAIGWQQLDKVVELLEKGYDPEDDFTALIEQYGSVEAVPDKVVPDAC